MTTPRRGFLALQKALDEARFGAERTLNLRVTLPRPVEAVARTEAWLREKQVSHPGEVLLITGRGNQSFDGIPVVREAVVRLLASLRRRGVVTSVVEHTPGSFVVSLASLRALRDAPRRRKENKGTPTPLPATLAGLATDTRVRLRQLAQRALEELGVQHPRGFVDAEMVAQFSMLASAVPSGPDREQRIRAAIEKAILEYDE